MTHEDIEIISKAGFYIAATMGVQDPSPIYRVLATSEHRDLSGTLQTKVIDITDQITTLLELLGKEHTQEPEPHRPTGPTGSRGPQCYFHTPDKNNICPLPPRLLTEAIIDTLLNQENNRPGFSFGGDVEHISSLYALDKNTQHEGFMICFKDGRKYKFTVEETEGKQ